MDREKAVESRPGQSIERAKEDEAEEKAVVDKPKSIVLFSDGTGNSSSKLFKTNVWRMYEAVDLDDRDKDCAQIVHYDEGVGNSAIRPLAALGSVFGLGLKRNVLDLYRFACRNHKDGDRIFAFGFSRGAFTIRMLVGLINKQGLVTYQGEADLARQSADAFRSYLKGRNPRFYPMRAILPAWRALVWLFIFLWRKAWRHRLYDPGKNVVPQVRFVGVWDTVAAYGGPITEIVRGFDDWIRPLTFKDHMLPDIVQIARQALALDDERDAFQPVPWDEPFGADRQRLQQIWFAGMHADVGGGYPDDSLAYVSLKWMMQEAQAAGLALRQDKVSETEKFANAYGPIHDSRSGVGSYYRYQPRNVGAYIHPPAPGTDSMRDPEYEDQGLAHRPWVDESVLCRIHAGTDGYAPITLPGTIKVVGRSGPRNVLPDDLQQRLDATAAKRTDRQESIRDLVWWRRVLYFLIVAATGVLVALPLIPKERTDPLCGDSRCYLGTPFGWLRGVLPEFAEPWIAAFERFAGITTALIVIIFLFRGLGVAAERTMRDRTRIVWRESIAGALTVPAMWAPIRPLRTSAAYQSGLKILKWWILPTVFGFGMLVGLIWAAWAVVGQVQLAAAENGDVFCKSGDPAVSEMATARPCNRLGVRVERYRSYEVNLYVRQEWSDGRRKTTPLGRRAHTLGPAGIFGAPLRRVVGAEYMRPLVEIELPPKARFLDQYRRVHIRDLEVRHVGGNHYQAIFEAPRTGSLSIFVNEAVVPFFDPDYFYSGSKRTENGGTACVSVAKLAAGKRQALTSCPEEKTKPKGAP